MTVRIRFTIQFAFGVRVKVSISIRMFIGKV